mgnify:CR=1 FL=1
MGIHRFFPWFKDTMNGSLIRMAPGMTFADLIDQDSIVPIDNFFIDLNGVFHQAAQKVYKYGNNKQPKRLLGRAPQIEKGNLKIKVFEEVCNTIEQLFHTVNPKKRLILCVDGPAPQSKQKQQRQRRFKSAMENSKSDRTTNTFDSNSITPGTVFMDHLTKYIDWYIRKKVSNDDRWQQLEEVVFSNEKVPGEGEHKVLNFIRSHNKPDESYCIHGLDSDLIMLALGTKLKHIYLLREDQFDHRNDFFCIDIGDVQTRLYDMMYWGEEGKKFNKNYVVNDFIFLCFLIGNDFLPQSPSIEVWNRGLDMIIKVYKEVCSQYGHITRILSGNVLFVKQPLKIFLGTIAQYEQVMLEEKIDSRVRYFPDKLLEQCTVIDHNSENKRMTKVDIELYRKLYYKSKFPSTSDEMTLSDICHEYLEGMQWVLSYYTKGVPNWKWFYPFHYAPFSHDLSKYVKTFRFPNYEKTVPNLPYQQLLCVLPPRSSRLIPSPLGSLLASVDSPIKQFYPDTFRVDVAGKRKEYEGVVILPIVDSDMIERVYNEYITRINIVDQKRNKHGKSFKYRYDPSNEELFESYYGNIPSCNVYISTIEL